MLLVIIIPLYSIKFPPKKDSAVSRTPNRLVIFDIRHYMYLCTYIIPCTETHRETNTLDLKEIFLQPQNCSVKCRITKSISLLKNTLGTI